MGKVNFTTLVTITETEERNHDEPRMDVVFVHGVGSACVTELASAVLIDDTADGFVVTGSGTISPPGGFRPPSQRINVAADLDPGRQQPYVAVVVRAVEQDHSSVQQRRADRDGLRNRIQRSVRAQVDTSPDAVTRTLMRVARAAPLSDDAGDDDDFIDVAVFEIADYGNTVSRFENRDRQTVMDRTSVTFGNRVMRQGSAQYDLTGSRVFYDPQPDLATLVTAINSRIGAVRSDEGARTFIAGHRSEDLALLSANSADRLLDLLFDGPTGGDEELAILKLVRALPVATMQDLEATHGKTASAFESEVDGDNWRQLKAELSRSISV